jgi:hypothetical protein
LEAKTSPRPSLRTFGWMSLAAPFSSATGAAGPKLRPRASRSRRCRGRSRSRGVPVRPPRRRRAQLVESAVGTVRPAGEVLRLAPAVPRVELREVDVPYPTVSRQRLAAHEQEASAADGDRAEVVGWRVDWLHQVHGRAEGGVHGRPVRDPDVQPTEAVRAVRGQVQAEPVRRLDRAAVEERRVSRGAISGDLVELLRRLPGREMGSRGGGCGQRCDQAVTPTTIAARLIGSLLSSESRWLLFSRTSDHLASFLRTVATADVHGECILMRVETFIWRSRPSRTHGSAAPRALSTPR